MPFYERQPYIQPLHQIIKEVMMGDIRVPRFQRPGTEATWRPEQRGDLLDSLYRGFPVGTILLWSTTAPIRTYGIVGGFRIPPLPEGAGRPQRLLLDGHQRLSTLVQILGPGLKAELGNEGITIAEAIPEEADLSASAETWVFDLSPDKSSETWREQFILLKPDQKPTDTQIPLSIVLNRSSMNRWIREKKLTDEQQTAADSLRDRLREYTIPVAVLVADSLQDATESFKRVNSSGTSMGDFHMVTALAFDENNDPQEQFAEARSEYLSPIQWDGISDTDALRVVAGLDLKTNPLKIDVASLAERLRKDRDSVKRAFQAIAAAAQLLRYCGVHGPESLPYIWQIITLAVHLGRSPRESFDEGAIDAAQRWFWLTTYGEVFAGVNSAVVDRSMSALQDMLDGKDWSKMERDVTRRVRPVTSFDFRTARSKACALAMARHQDADNREGPAHRALTTGVDAMQLLWGRGRRSRWWDLAIVTPERGISAFREALRRRERGESPAPEDSLNLQLLGVEPTDSGSLEDLLAARRDRLVAEERAFVRDLGLEWAQRE